MFVGSPVAYQATPATSSSGTSSGPKVGSPVAYVATAAVSASTSTPKAGAPTTYVATAATQQATRLMKVAGVLKSVRRITLAGLPGTSTAVYDYSAWNYTDSYQPMSNDPAKWVEDFPTGMTYVNLIVGGSGNFKTDVDATLASTSATDVIVVLPPGTYHLKSFYAIGPQTAAKPYLVGYWDSSKRLRGFLRGSTAGKSIIQLDANAYTADQLTPLKAMTLASYSQLLNSFMRFDGPSAARPVLLGGITFQAADQPLLDTVASDVPAVVPQPAPHQGPTFYPGSYYVVNDCEFLGAATALMSQGPFEMGNVSSQRCFGRFKRCDLDGRRAAALDPARPRRCTIWMGNDEGSVDHIDCHLHHSNVSRYAANDEGNSFGVNGHYGLLRCKIDHIADLQNRDPAQNGGNSLDGYTDPCCLGWESSNAQITLEDVIVSVDNPYTTRNIPMHLGFTSTGRNTAGGHLTVKRLVALDSVHPSLNGFLCIRAKPTNTVWVSATDAMSKTADFISTKGTVMTAQPYTGTAWPPPASFLSSLDPDKHVIVKTS